MKPFLIRVMIVALALGLGGTGVHAEQKFVKELMKITLRTGPGNDRKIVALINTGQAVDVLEEGEEWSIVRLPDGKEGYVLTRFITSEEPSSISLANLKQRYDILGAQKTTLSEENTKLKETLQQLTTEFQASAKALKTLQKEYDTLKTESADFLKLKAKDQQTTAQLAEQSKRADKFEDDFTKLLRNQNIKWFLSGAGVLILGFIIGYSSKRQSRRSSLL
jgi:SH3 domain protein